MNQEQLYQKALYILTEEFLPEVEIRGEFYTAVCNKESMKRSIAEEKAKKHLAHTTPESILAKIKVYEFSTFFEEADFNDYYVRETATGYTFSVLEEGISIEFAGDEIRLFQDGVFMYESKDIQRVLNEVVELDMRSKKFRNVMKRKGGDQYCKETERVDMRRKGFKEAMKRKEACAAKKNMIVDDGIAGNEIDIDGDGDEDANYVDPREAWKNEVFNKHVMQEEILSEEDHELLDIFFEESEDLIMQILESDFMWEDESILDEVLSRQARKAIGRAARKNAKKNAKKRELSSKRMASPEKLKGRARKSAVAKIKSKLTAKASEKGELSLATKERIEKKIGKMSGKIDKMAKKALPQMKKAEKERLATKRKG